MSKKRNDPHWRRIRKDRIAKKIPRPHQFIDKRVVMKKDATGTIRTYRFQECEYCGKPNMDIE